MKVLVCGGRYFDCCDEVFLVLDEIYNDNSDGDFSIVHGACHADYLEVKNAEKDSREPQYSKQIGVDYFADMWARSRNIPQKRYPAQWYRFKKGAGPKRNKYMFWKELPHLCIAFEGGRGTEGMKNICYNAGIEVFDVPTCQILQSTNHPH